MKIQKIDEIEINDQFDLVKFTSLFEENYRRKQRPLIIRGGADHWPAKNKWTLEYIINTCGFQQVDAMFYGMRRPVPVKKTVTEIVNAIEKGEKIYISQAKVDQDMPFLMDDIQTPYGLERKKINSIQAFIGNQTYASMHFHHGSEAMITQLVGRKMGLLFSPDTDLNPFLFLGYNFSRIMFDKWLEDRANIIRKYPKLRNICAYECSLMPGDQLYIPNYWWHSFFGENLSMSVTYWWKDIHPIDAVRPVNVAKLRFLESVYGKMLIRLTGFVAKIMINMFIVYKKILAWVTAGIMANNSRT